MRRTLAITCFPIALLSASTALPQPRTVIVEVRNGLFTIDELDDFQHVFVLNDATVEMTGGTINLVDTLDKSSFLMTGGQMQYPFVLGSSTFTLEGGLVDFEAFVYENATMFQTGGRIKEGASLGQNGTLHLSGGIMNGSIRAYSNADIIVTAREFNHDHDNNQSTPNIPIDFAGENELVLLAADPLFLDGYLFPNRPTPQPAAVLLDLTPTWADGSRTTFDFAGRNSPIEEEGDWIGTLTLRLLEPTDLTGDRVVNNSDLAALFAAWGTCGDSPCAADINNDATVNAADLAELLADWG